MVAVVVVTVGLIVAVLVVALLAVALLRSARLGNRFHHVNSIAWIARPLEAKIPLYPWLDR